jgi:hypothetical protein
MLDQTVQPQQAADDHRGRRSLHVQSGGVYRGHMLAAHVGSPLIVLVRASPGRDRAPAHPRILIAIRTARSGSRVDG